MDFYRQMPDLYWGGGEQGNRLVYFEELQSESAALERFYLLSRFTRAQKEKQIREVNPDWVDLSIGLDFERMLVSQSINFPLNIEKAA